MSISLILAAILPAIFIIVQVYRADRFEKEPVSLILKLVVGGILSTIVAMILEYIGEGILDSFLWYRDPLYNVLFYYIVVAGSEELVKYYVLKKVSYNHDAYNCMFDGIVYAVAVSLGFALLENIMYVFEAGFSVAVIRAFTAIPGHASFGVFMGVWYGYAKRMQILNDVSMEKKMLVCSVVIPMLIHGTYDYVLSLNSCFVIIIFISFIALMFAAAIYVVRKVSKDDFFFDEDIEL